MPTTTTSSRKPRRSREEKATAARSGAAARKRFPWRTVALALAPLLMLSVGLGAYLAWSQPPPGVVVRKAEHAPKPDQPRVNREDIPISQEHVTLREQLADTSFRQGNYAEAEKGYREIGKFMTDTDLAGFRIYVCLLARHDAGGAARFLGSYDERVEAPCRYYNEAARLFFAGQPEEARRQTAEGRQRFPGRSQPYDESLRLLGFSP